MAAAAIHNITQMQRDNVFTSVFAPKNHSTPTPEVTPNVGTLASPGAAFGGFNIPSSPGDAAVQHARGWSTITRFLALPPGLDIARKDLSHSPATARTLGLFLDGGSKQSELSSWYLHEIGAHFRRYVLPELDFWRDCVEVPGAVDALFETVKILERAQRFYLGVFCEFDDRRTDPLGAFMKHIRHEVHVSVLHALPRARVQKTLAYYFFQTMKNQLEASSDPERCLRTGRCECRPSLDVAVLRQLPKVGLGGNLGMRALAAATHKLLEGPAIERRCFGVDWSGKLAVADRVKNWAGRELMVPLLIACQLLTGSFSPQDQSSHLGSLVSVAEDNFGRLRIASLFDYVKLWPHSQGAVLDIGIYLREKGAAEKLFLCTAFSQQIESRILHAGASTSEILSIYINVISVFKLLDSRGVLLEKVALPIRNYLRGRDDTVNIIAASMLAEIDKGGDIRDIDHEKVCVDLAMEIANYKINPEIHKALNYNDMSWVPDPIEAGPDYKSSKSDDIVANILGLFDQEDFLQAFHAALGQHLLRAVNPELAKETKLVELLKSRMDSTKVQSLEVMLKDMRDSAILTRRLKPPPKAEAPTPKDIQAAIPIEGITMGSLYKMFEGRMNHRHFTAAVRLVATHRNDLLFPKRTRLSAEAARPSPTASPRKTAFNMRVVLTSGHYWPTRRAVTCKLPGELVAAHAVYGNEFSAQTGGQRRAEFDHGSGIVDFDLHLEDRIFPVKKVETYKAAVIWAFVDRPPLPTEEDAPTPYDASIGLTIADLISSLDLPEDLVIDALSFWTSKQVLYQLSPGHYAVLERLDMAVAAVPEPLETAAVEVVSAEDAMLREKADVYQNFIVGMLRNQGAKRIDGMMGITMVLKMVDPDFIFGDEGVRWLMGEMERKGVVKSEGEVFTAL